MSKKVSNFMASMAQYAAPLAGDFPIVDKVSRPLTPEECLKKHKQNKKKQLKKLAKKSRQKNRKK